MVVLAAVAEVHADILVFTNGRTLAVRQHVVDGDVISVTLRNGGVATFQGVIVARIDPEAMLDESDAGPADSAVTVEPAGAVIAGQTLDAPPFAGLIHDVAARHGVDPRLVHAVVRTESNYQPRARSSKGARGLMQVLPSTAAALGVVNLDDPSGNLDVGVRYLKGLLAEFSLPEALAAYNAGPAAVRRFGGVPPFVETRHYVARVLAQLR
jgi:soluble lytic murein transglycosylase-like protein